MTSEDEKEQREREKREIQLTTTMRVFSLSEESLVGAVVVVVVDIVAMVSE